MARQGLTDLSANEMSVVASAHKNSVRWTCKICLHEFLDVVPLVAHLLTSCDNRNKMLETSSLVRVCCHLDQWGCQKLLQSYTHVYGIDPRKRNTVDVGHPIQDDSTTDDGSGMTDDNSVALPKRKQARKGFPDLDVLDQELLGDGASSQEDRRSEEDGTFQRRAAKPLESSRFQSTPPAWLTKRDRIEWETRQQQYSRMSRLREIYLTSKGHTDWPAVLAAWNSTYGKEPGYKSYCGGNTMATRLSRDKSILLALEAKKPANWDETHHIGQG